VLRDELGVTGDKPPVTPSQFGAGFVYHRGCVKDRMKTRYRLIRRGVRNGAFYCVDKETGKRTSLHTGNEDEARQIINARNQSLRQGLWATQSGIHKKHWDINQRQCIGRMRGRRKFCCRLWKITKNGRNQGISLQLFNLNRL
jgi:hypothetical protein